MEKLDYLPAATEDQFNIKQTYKTFKGWKTNKRNKKYERFWKMQKNIFMRLKILYRLKSLSVSTSPEREDTILIEDPF